MKMFLFVRAIIFSFLFMPLMTLYASGIGILHSFILRDDSIMDGYAHRWAQALLWFLNVEVKYLNEENIPQTSCLFLFNHSSNADIFAIYRKYFHIKFGAKIELFSIPFFGAALNRAGMLPIARSNREDVFKVYQQALPRVQRGDQFALAPEGGRGTAEKLRPFKSGPFIFAINAGIPIVPVVIKGAYQLWPNQALLPQCQDFKSTITVQFLPAISAANYDLEKRKELQSHVFEIMSKYF